MDAAEAAWLTSPWREGKREDETSSRVVSSVVLCSVCVPGSACRLGTGYPFNSPAQPGASVRRTLDTLPPVEDENRSSVFITLYIDTV